MQAEEKNWADIMLREGEDTLSEGGHSQRRPVSLIKTRVGSKPRRVAGGKFVKPKHTRDAGTKRIGILPVEKTGQPEQRTKAIENFQEIIEFYEARGWKRRTIRCLKMLRPEISQPWQKIEVPPLPTPRRRVMAKGQCVSALTPHQVL